jgi:hypothetical protein
MDKGERTPIVTVPTSDPVIGKPHPGATLDYSNDPRFKTQFQESMKQTEFPFDPLVGEAAYSTTEPLSYERPVAGRSGEEQLYTSEHDIGKPDQLWHTPETEKPVGADQKTLAFEKNPDLYKLLQLANTHAKYAPANLEPMAMEARQARFGKVANELRDTIKDIEGPLPQNVDYEDLSNILRTSGGEGTTGEQIQNLRADTTKRMGLQEDLAPIARGDKELALVSRGKGFNDTRAMAQELAQKYNLPQLLEESDLMSKAEGHVKGQEDYFKDLYATNKENKYNKQRYEDQLERHAERMDKFERQKQKISEKNAKLLADFGKRSLGILPSQRDLYNLSTRSMFAPMNAAMWHFGAEKAGRLAGFGLMKAGKYLPEDTTALEKLSGPWKRASLIDNVLAPREEESIK